MKHRVMFAMLAVTLGLIVGCAQAPQGPTAEEMVSAANALDQAFIEAFNRGDADAIASLYWNSPEVVSFPPDVLQARGLVAIQDANAKFFTAMQGAKLELTESHQMPAGDVVVGWGLWHITMPAPDGGAVELAGRYTDVKAERDGTWVYLIDHASAPLPAPSEQ